MKWHADNIPAARQLRRAETPSEALLWEQLRDRRLHGFKFRRQHAFGAFVVDLYCAERRLAVGVDGGVHDAPEAQARDAARQLAVEDESDVRFLRVRSWDVEGDMGEVLQAIVAALTLTPDPSPSAEGEGN